MCRLTQSQYKARRSEWEMLAIAIDDKTLPDGIYHKTKDRLDLLTRVLENHWTSVHAIGVAMTDQERVARTLTRWMNGKRQDPLPDWNTLSESVKAAYLEQAAEAITALRANAP